MISFSNSVIRKERPIPRSTKREKSMSVKVELMNEVSRRADTVGIQLNVAEVKRTIAIYHDVLKETLSPEERLQFLTKELFKVEDK